MGLTLITPPADEPITLAEAKLHCRIDSDAEDVLLMTLIRSARMRAERCTGRAIPAQTFKQTFNSFPDWYFSLARPPLISVTSIVYTSTAGVLTTLSSALYRVSTTNEPGLIEPSYDEGSWPTAQDIVDSVAVTFKAGYACTSIAAATATGSQTVTPGSMAGIVEGSVLTINVGQAQETVVVTAVAATTFTATFAKAHGANTKVTAVPEDLQERMLLCLTTSYDNRPGDPTLDAYLDGLFFGNWTGEYR